MTENIVIIGNGGAALHAIESARVAGYNGRLKLISDSSGPAFNPMLSPYYIEGKITFDKCFPFGNRFYKRHDVTCLFGSAVKRLNPENKSISLENGEKLQYDRCLIATGARPMFPPIPGLTPSERIMALRTPDDTVSIKKAMQTSGSVVILGASLIGLKLAEIFAMNSIKVTLVDIAAQILPTAAVSECAKILEQLISNEGINLRLNSTLQNIDHGEKGLSLSFGEGNKIESDICIAGTGIKPNMDFIENRSIEIERGLIINSRMQTSDPNIFAAGDVCQSMNPLSGDKELIGLWGSACLQGRTAGSNMAGREKVFQGTIPDHVSTIFGHEFIHIGDVLGKGESIKHIDLSGNGDFEPANCFLVFNHDRLVGANIINDTRFAGRLKRVVSQGVQWEEYLDRFENHPSFEELENILRLFNI